MITAQTILIMFMPACLVICMMTDYYAMMIPNYVCAALLLFFPAFAAFFGMQWLEIAHNYTASVLVLICSLPLYITRQMGAGDIKLLASISAWFGINISLILFLVAVSLIGAIITILIIYIRGNNVIFSATRVSPPAHIMSGKAIPYGIAIGIAGLIVYPHAPIMRLAIHHLASL